MKLIILYKSLRSDLASVLRMLRVSVCLFPLSPPPPATLPSFSPEGTTDANIPPPNLPRIKGADKNITLNAYNTTRHFTSLIIALSVHSFSYLLPIFFGELIRLSLLIWCGASLWYIFRSWQNLHMKNLSVPLCLFPSVSLCRPLSFSVSPSPPLSPSPLSRNRNGNTFSASMSTVHPVKAQVFARPC